MPLQNRITPFGEIVAVPDRGTFMGNRGRLIGSDGRMKQQPWHLEAWIICRLDYKGPPLPLRDPHCNTQLFFLDEATALAAGHRPCWRCRGIDGRRFRDAWLSANPTSGLPATVTIGEIDKRLHAERITAQHTKVTHQARLGALPEGVFVVLDREPGAAFLIARGRLWRWSPGGYTQAPPLDWDIDVSVLTPGSIVNAVLAGYNPSIHSSVQ